MSACQAGLWQAELRSAWRSSELLCIPPQPQTIELKLLLRHLAFHFSIAGLAAWAVPLLRVLFREGDCFACSALRNAEKLLRSFLHLLVLVFLVSGRTAVGRALPWHGGNAPSFCQPPTCRKPAAWLSVLGLSRSASSLSHSRPQPNNSPVARQRVRRS